MRVFDFLLYNHIRNYLILAKGLNKGLHAEQEKIDSLTYSQQAERQPGYL